MTRHATEVCPPLRRILYPAAAVGWIVVVWIVAGWILAGWIVVGCVGCRALPSETDRLFHDLATAPPDTRRFDPADPMQRRAASDPLAFLKACRRHYVENVRDYRCRFTLQERSNGTLGPIQEMNVRFREEPFSVDLRWVRNPPQANRVNYVEGRWARHGREYALIELSGMLALLAPNGVKRHIHAPDMVAAARGTIDRFGFKNTLDSIIENCERAHDDPAYDLRFLGIADLDERPCFVFRRILPEQYTTERHVDPLLLIYIDRQWLLPTGCFGYADMQGKKLLGAYVTTAIHLNPGLTDADF